MTLPAKIVSDLAFLQQQVAVAAPMSKASRATIVACQLNAANLVKETETAQYTLAGVLDTWMPPPEPTMIVSGVLGVVGNANDERDIVQMRGLVGRAASNLDQLP